MNETGLGVQALPPAAQQQPDNNREIGLRLPVAKHVHRRGSAGVLLRLRPDQRVGQVHDVFPIDVQDGAGRLSKERDVRDEQPAELDRHRREHDHFPVDEPDPVVDEGDVRQLEIAMQDGDRQRVEGGDQRGRVGGKVMDEPSGGR